MLGLTPARAQWIGAERNVILPKPQLWAIREMHRRQFGRAFGEQRAQRFEAADMHRIGPRARAVGELEAVADDRHRRMVRTGDDRQLAMAPSTLQGFVSAVRETYDRLAESGEIPCLLTNPSVRPFVRSIIERVRPSTVVLSQNEIHARARIRALGTVS